MSPRPVRGCSPLKVLESECILCGVIAVIATIPDNKLNGSPMMEFVWLDLDAQNLDMYCTKLGRVFRQARGTRAFRVRQGILPLIKASPVSMQGGLRTRPA